MSPNKNVDSLNYSNEKTDVKSEKGFSLKQKIGALLLGAGLFVGAQGILSPEKSPFPKGYHNVPTVEDASVVHASTAVEIPDANTVAAEQEPVVPLTEPYVTATHSVEAPTTTENATNIDSESTKGYWKHFEERHANDPEPVPDKTPADTSTTSGNHVE